MDKVHSGVEVKVVGLLFELRRLRRVKRKKKPIRTLLWSKMQLAPLRSFLYLEFADI
jgi:hypothetical protein